MPLKNGWSICSLHPFSFSHRFSYSFIRGSQGDIPKVCSSWGLILTRCSYTMHSKFLLGPSLTYNLFFGIAFLLPRKSWILKYCCCIPHPFFSSFSHSKQFLEGLVANWSHLQRFAPHVTIYSVTIHYAKIHRNTQAGSVSNPCSPLQNFPQIVLFAYSVLQ